MSQYRDILAKDMPTRTWPYGTKKSVQIAHIESNFVLVVDEDKAGYGLIGQKITGKVDDKGTITFTEGGPMGAYWHFTPEPR